MTSYIDALDFFLIAGGIALLCHFVVLPLLERRAVRDDEPDVIIIDEPAPPQTGELARRGGVR